MSEQTKTVPLLEEVAAALLQKGKFNRNLSDVELAEVMRSVVNGLVGGVEKVSAAITNLGVHIDKQRGNVEASVQVSKPISAGIDLNVTLGNDTNDHTRLALVGLTVNERAGMAAKLALKAVNLKGRAASVLQDPNTSLFNAFNKQLSQRGAKLTGMQLQFTSENTLAVGLQGQPAPTSTR